MPFDDVLGGGAGQSHFIDFLVEFEKIGIDESKGDTSNKGNDMTNEGKVFIGGAKILSDPISIEFG